MSPKVLVTGGAGYIGGSIIAELLTGGYDGIQGTNLSTTVRSTGQIQALSKLGIKVLQLDIDDEASVVEVIVRNEIDIVVHTASSALPAHAHNLINALGQRHKLTGKEVYFVHSGLTAVFSEEGGWPYGEIRDSDNIYEQEKTLGTSHPVREVNQLVVDKSKALGVTAFNVIVPHVYGTGSGEGRKVSVAIPAFIRTSIKEKIVHKFDKDAYAAQVHVADLTKVYGLLLSKIVKREDVPSGEQGYYFAFAHRASWWDFMQRLASNLYQRGLVLNPEPQIWPSYEMAAETLAWPPQHVRAMGTNSGQYVAVNAYKHLGWQPQWHEKDFLGYVDEEVENVLENGHLESNLFKSLMETK